jgi:phycobilisome core component
MKDIVKAMVAETGVANPSFIDQPFDHMNRELSEQDI